MLFVPSWSFYRLYDEEAFLDLNQFRANHSATLLPSGKLLIKGGMASGSDRTLDELYDPDSGTFSYFNPMNTNRSRHSATLLHDGTVLIAGGERWQDGYRTLLADAAIFDLYGRYSAVGSLAAPGEVVAATLLADGRVLVRGTEIDDPITRTFSSAGVFTGRPMSFVRISILLPGGQVLLSDGFNMNLYDPRSCTYRDGGCLPRGINGLISVGTGPLLPSGYVLFTGEGRAYLYDPETGSSVEAGTPLYARSGHKATLLPSGLVLIADGTVGGFEWRRRRERRGCDRGSSAQASPYS